MAEMWNEVVDTLPTGKGLAFAFDSTTSAFGAG